MSSNKDEAILIGFCVTQAKNPLYLFSYLIYQSQNQGQKPGNGYTDKPGFGLVKLGCNGTQSESVATVEPGFLLRLEKKITFVYSKNAAFFIGFVGDALTNTICNWNQKSS